MMTKQQIAELLLKMNDDCSNVECYSPTLQICERIETHDNYAQIMTNIALGHILRIIEPKRIKITNDLRGKWFQRKGIAGLIYTPNHINLNEKMIEMDGIEYNEDSFNEIWELVD